MVRREERGVELLSERSYQAWVTCGMAARRARLRKVFKVFIVS